MNVYNIVTEIKNTSSSKAKEAILRSHKDNDVLREFFRLTLDPKITFYIKKIPDWNSDSILGRKLDLRAALSELSVLSSRVKTGGIAIEHLRRILASVSTGDAELIRAVIRKNSGCGIASSTANKVWPGLIESFPVMLATAFDEKIAAKLTFPLIVQTKMDGARACVIVEDGDVNLFTRQGNPILISAFNHLSVLDDGVYDGEIVARAKDGSLLDRKTGNGLVNKAVQGTIGAEDEDLLHLVLWDFIPLDEFWGRVPSTTKYSERLLAVLPEAIDGIARISTVRTTIVRNRERLLEEFDRELAEGNEGIIAKSLDHVWEPKRSKHLVKFKAENDCDLRIVGFTPGLPDSKYSHTLGSLVCESSDGKIVVNVSGMDDKTRNDIWTNRDAYVDKILTVRYNCRIKDKSKNVESLYLPRFVEVRFDKTTADDSKDIK